MADLLGFQINRDEAANQPDGVLDREIPSFEAAVCRRIDVTGAELTTCTPACVRLNLEDLQCFEAVDYQFQDWGVVFNNAIAVHPSNPAYPVRGGKMVLMGAPKTGWLEAKFAKPVQFVSSFVTSSRRTVLSAFDANNKEIAQTSSPGANLAGSDSKTPPNLQLSIKGNAIHRITLHAFDGNLTVSDFSFSQ